MIYLRKPWRGVNTYFWEIEYAPMPATGAANSGDDKPRRNRVGERYYAS